ncbi:MAG: electron transfer flavoprotein subunit alpha [Oscillospiraceae bacterium]|nr:MAG: electron transfer flavoprotein subunit alpha [Oscillospiraceae bacterium]
MGQLKINQNLVNAETAKALTAVCPFGALSYDGTKLEISAACKMCKLCVKKGPKGVMEFVEGDVRPTVDKSLWRGVCVFVDHDGDKIHRVTYELLGKARELAAVTGHPVYALLLGHNVSACAEKLLHYGADKIFVYDNAALADFRIEPYTAAFCDFIDKIKPSSILVGATNLGRQLAPRVAARCRAGLTADCTVLEMKENTDLVQIRPAFGGNIMAQIISPDCRPQFCTARYKVFTEPKPTAEAHGEIVKMEIAASKLQSAIDVLFKTEKPKDVDISEADVIVAVGRGAKSEQNREMAKALADALGGVVACTRPLVEENIFDAKQQIGLSGRTVKPKLIICLGISGAVQFAAGMKSSDCIIAINTDPHAPIFDVAHYGIVGDLNAIVPLLLEKINAKENGHV